MKAICRRKALFVFRDHCRRGVSGARDAPIWVRDHVNRKLSEMPDYRTHVGVVTLHFWRGAYSVHNINVVKTSGKVPVPFFSAPMCLQKRLHSGVPRKTER